MEVAIEDRARVWRDRGRPRKTVEIPDKIREMADATYGTGKVITLTPDTEEDKQEARELLTLLRAYARSIGRHLKTQRQSGKILCEIVDKPGDKGGRKK